MMKTKKNKIKKMVALIISIAAVVITVILVAFFINKHVPSSQIQNKPVTVVNITPPEKPSRQANSFFPKKLDLKKIYSLIRIKKGKYYFRDELATLVLNQVIKKGSFVNGKLSYQYSFKDAKKIFAINFKWTSSSGETQSKKYSIKITI